MNKEEYIKYVENNEELNNDLELNSAVNAIGNILINKNICTKKELKELKEKYKKQMLDDSYARENPEDLKNAKTINDFFKMFGGK